MEISEHVDFSSFSVRGQLKVCRSIESFISRNDLLLLRVYEFWGLKM